MAVRPESEDIMFTKGKWETKETIQNSKDSIFYHTDIICRGKRVAKSSGIGIEEAEDNARLIAEAGTVANETGFTPRQLADQKADLLKACKFALDAIGAGFSCESEAKARLKQAIAKAEKQG